MSTVSLRDAGRHRGIPAPAPATRPCAGTLRWRREQLVAAGFDELTAHRIAANGTVDIHALVVSTELRGGPAEGGRRGR
jgi:hypothetical protein